MARQDVNIGLTGNDGTGDSIRDAFNKVNENFQELYASQGLEGGLAFESLSNVIKPLVPNRVLSLDALGKNVVGKEIYAGAGISIAVQDDRIVISTGAVDVVRDPNPTLSNHLDAALNRIQRLSAPIADQDAVNRRWIYENFLNRDGQEVLGVSATAAGSTMRQNFKITPTPNNGNTNLGTLAINLKGSDGITPKTDVLLNQQGTHPAHAVRKDYADSKLSLEGTNAIDPESGLRNEGFGTMTGPLILNDHPGDLATLTLRPSGQPFVRDDYRAATKGYVDARTYDSTTNIYVSTQGNDDIWDFVNNRPNPAYGYTVKEIGRKWATAFRTVRAACAYSKLYMDQISLTNTPYVVPVANISRYNPTFAPAGARTRVRVSLQGHGYRDGDYVFVAGAITVGNNNTTALNGTHRVNQIDNNNFELDLKEPILWANPLSANGFINISLANAKDGPYSNTSTVGFGSRGYYVPKYEITIHIETGVYEEQLPIVVPPNVALRGDEFRRTIIKPAQGPVPSSNQTIKYVKGERSLNYNYWYNSHYYHQLALSVGSVNIVGSTTLRVYNAAYAPKAGMRFIVNNIVYRVGAEVTISYINPAEVPGTLPGTYSMSIVDENGDPKPLQNTILDSSGIEFLLDNDHCDMLLVGDAFQARNLSFYGHKGFIMAFDPAAQILTRSPYAQVCGSFSNKGGGGQLIDGAAGNQVCFVQDNTYTDPFTGTQGARGSRVTVTGLIRKVQLPNTFYYNKKKYVIIDATQPDSNGTAILTLSSTTPIEDDDTYLPAGFLPTGTQLMIETAGNRSMLSNDFTMINDLGYGLLAENNGVAEAVSQFTYYCKISYASRSGGQIRSVTGSSCYGQIGLQSEGSDPNEAQQIVRFNTDVINLMTPVIDNPTADANIGAVSFIAGSFNSKPVRNATFILNKNRVIINTIQRARLSGGTVTTGPLKVTTTSVHPFLTGEQVQITNIKPNKGLQLNPLVPGGEPRGTNVDGTIYTVTVIDQHNFTLDGTESLDYYNDLLAYTSTESQPIAVQPLVEGALETVYTIKGDPTERNFSAKARFDGDAGENSTSTDVLKIFASEYPAVKGMKFRLDGTIPAVSVSTQVYKVLEVEKKVVTFKAYPVSPSDNIIGSTSLIVKFLTAGYTPTAGWSFQLRDTNIANSNYQRYVVTGTPAYDSLNETWELPLNAALTVNMVNQVATGEVTVVDGIWDLTLDRNLGTTIPNNATPVQFNFFNGYWSLNVDPALNVAMPQNKPLMLYQQKSVAVHQVLNRPTIINSSALKFGSSNFDTTVYRILGKTADGGLSTDVFKLAETAQPLVGVNLNAVSILNQNKSFIQAEVINYLSTIYPDFVYTQATCYRDVGLIIDAVAYDLTYGGNVRSIGAGLSYYQANNTSAATVVATQKPETVDAINYATSVAKLVLAKTALSYDGVNENAVRLLEDNKEFIKAEVIAWLNFNYSTFSYDQAKCKRDVGLIIDAVLADLVFGSNFQSTFAGLAYLRSYSSTVTTSQKTQTILGINKARDLVNALINDQVAEDLISGYFGVITGIINSGAGSAPALLYPTPTNTLTETLNSKNLVIANRAFMISEVIAYINDNLNPGSIPNYSAEACSRDTGYIIDSITYDLLYGGNTQTVNAGNAYFSGLIQILSPGEIAPTVAAFTRLQTIIQQIVVNTAVTKSASNTASQNSSLPAGSASAGNTLSTLISYILDIIQNGIASGPTVVQPTFTNGNTSYVGYRTTIRASKTTIEEDVIDYLDANLAGFVYDETICARDVGYIIDAVAYDIKYGGNVKTLQAALKYYEQGNASAAVVLSDQKAETLAALVRARDVAVLCVTQTLVTKTTGNTLNQNTAGSAGEAGTNTTITSLMNMLNDIITNGEGVAPARDLGEPRLYQNPATPGYVSQTIPVGINAEAGTGTLLQQKMDIIAGILNNGASAVPAIQQGISTIQTLTFPSDANMLIYGGVLTGPGIPANTIIRASQQDPNTGYYIAKISNIITGTISAGTELTVTGPGYDFIFDLNTALDERHVAGDRAGVTTTFSTVRATGHDFLEVGTGSFDDSNYPHNVYDQPVNSPSDGAIIKEVGTGRVFHVSTDQNGNFRVGSYFNVNQGDGTVSITAKIGLTAVSSLSFVTGVPVSQFSPDGKMGDNSDNIVSTQKAIVTYINSLIKGRFDVDNSQTPNKGLLTLDGTSTMVGDIKVGNNRIEGVVNSVDPFGFGIVNKKYVDNAFAGGEIDYDGQYGITVSTTRTGVLGFTMRQDRTTVGGAPQLLGQIDANNNKIVNLKAPTVAGDAASKAYVDQTIASGGVRTNWDGFSLRPSGTYYTVGSVNTGNAGSGYTTPPIVTITGGGGTGAVGRATLSGGGVSGIIIETGGYGYTSTPSIIIGGAVAEVQIVSAGSNYVTAPLIDFPAPQTSGGIKASAVTRINSTGQITGVTIINGGSGYTSAPVPFLVVNTGGATFTSSLNPGSGATAVAVMVPTPLTINLNNNKVTGSADPTVATDLVNLQYFNNNHYLKDITDVTITGTPSDGDLLMFAGYVPANESDKRRTIVNVRLTVDSDLTFVRTNNQVRAKLNDNTIVNAQISPSAAIAQSKLNLRAATTFPPLANPTQTVPTASDLGVATFDESVFVLDNGLVRLRQASNATTGIRPSNIAHVSNFTILGRNDTAVGAPAKGAVVELNSADLRSLLNFTEAVQNLISDDSLNSPLVNTQAGLPSYGAVLKTGSSMRGPLTFDAGNQDPSSINPWLRVIDDNVYELGSSTKRFKNIHSALFTGTFSGNITGNLTGTASNAAKTDKAMSAGTGIIISNGVTSTSFNGSQAVTISTNSSESATPNTLAMRDSSSNITATKFIGTLQGTADNATQLGNASATVDSAGSGSANSIAKRDGSGNLNANLFQGTATSARYADLAENYVADKAYEPGTVLEFGGEKEVTIAEDETRRVAGVVSTNPAHLMNSTLVGDTVVALALTGRVPCKVRGKIRKGDMLVSGGGGYARPTTDPKLGTIIGKALEDFDGVEGVIEVVVGRL